MPRRAVMIVNPMSGRGRARAAGGAVAAALQEAGFEVQSHVTAYPGHATMLAGDVVMNLSSQGPASLVVLGGDGTLNEVVTGVLRTGDWPDDLTVTPLPLGTGNSFIQDFDIRTGAWDEAIRRLQGAIDGVRHGTVSEDEPRATTGSGSPYKGGLWVDAARVYTPDGAGNPRAEPYYFVNVFGTGFMARVADVTNRRLKALGAAGYTVGVFWQLARLSAPQTRITLAGPDGEREVHEKMALVAVCNSQWTGDRMWIAPHARASDGVLDVLTLGTISRLGLVRLFPRIFKGAHLDHPLVKHYRAHRVTITPSDPGPLLIDGEVIGRTPCTIEVVPRAVKVAL